ncbi:dystroglycan isoform X3 [Bradysia coprophila]|uniref:dystroglycan isoform X3 n=1 Tax=Bradysia coprophila TaxID=38358 RepID=UPI00187D85A4|nr:dystroglycan isoform X3 [Bradysia coprophila]
MAWNKYRHCVNHVNSNWKLTVIYLSLFCLLPINGQDFQFESNTDDDLHVVFTEPQDIVNNGGPTKLSPYEEEVAKCPYTESKIILTLILRSNSWEDIISKKQDRAIKKLAKFFAIPKDSISVGDVHGREIYEMTKYAIHKGIDRLDGHKKLGKIEFVIGCGNSYLPSGQLIANQISRQINDGSIDDISGLDIGYWLIWSKRVNNRTPRNKRQAETGNEGSGEDDYDDDYYDNDDDTPITEIAQPESHPHRHQHGYEKTETEEPSSSVAPTIIVTTTEEVKEVVKSTVTTTTESATTQETEATVVVTERKTEPTIVSITERVTVKTSSTPIYETDYSDEYEEVSTIPSSTTSSERERIVPLQAVPSFATIERNNVFAATSTIPTTNRPTTTTEYIEPEPVNYPPAIKNRMQKLAVTAGKPFSIIVPIETFFDNEDGTNLKLSLTDKNDNPLKQNSWIQFNAENREIYGLPLEDAVSKWQFLLRASDSSNESVVETVDIAVQQHKAHRTANHDISIGVKLIDKFRSNVDWQIRLIKGIIDTLHDTSSTGGIEVREIRHSIQDLSAATFVYTNDTLPKDKCPEEKLDELIQRLTVKALSQNVPEMEIKFVSGKPIGPCLKIELPKPKAPKPTPHMTKNYPPVPRNQVDRVNATIGQLLVFKVPTDTFYDPEDNTDLKLSLLSLDRAPLDPRHWLQFDAKNQEFFGIPKYGDAGQKEFLLVAEDREGLSATDALVVVVSHPLHREYNTLFEMTLGMPYDEFNNSAVQRRFVERIAQIFGDTTTSSIQIRAIRKMHQSGKTLINYYNTTLHRPHHVCPTEHIEQLRKVLIQSDGNIRHRVKDTLGGEFDLNKVNLIPMGACLESDDTVHHAHVPVKTDDTQQSNFSDDYLLTFVLPAVVIILMILIAAIIACCLHRRRMTGKMELGDEEERRSFRSKGIPVIFQDELDEKPEIGNKSPIILKDEKPPLLPPSYNSTNPDDQEDMDEYVPPPAVVMNGRETRGKSPVTPSYRKPPPYVSP